MVLSLTVDGHRGVKTARSYPLLTLESSFSARFCLYRIEVFYPFEQKNPEQDVNRHNKGIASTLIPSA
jgi:hypothetical protein